MANWKIKKFEKKKIDVGDVRWEVDETGQGPCLMIDIGITSIEP
jgi:hypothetical protein